MTGTSIPPDAGIWVEVDGGRELRFERWLRHAPEHVWEALTTPEGLRCWLAEAMVDPAPGGRLDLNFRQPAHDCFPDTPEVRNQFNQILVWQPLERFDHTFGHEASIVSWRLESHNGGTRLTLIHRVPHQWDLSRTLAGWHHHLEGLSSAVGRMSSPWNWTRWLELRDSYAALAGANSVTPRNR